MKNETQILLSFLCSELLRSSQSKVINFEVHQLY
jgi:hypothetical protein